jgi:hypothetical protein
MFMFQYSMTRFEHIFKKQMLKATYVFIQQHHFFDIESKIFLDIYIKHENVLKKFQVKIWSLECTIYIYKPFLGSFTCLLNNPILFISNYFKYSINPQS